MFIQYGKKAFPCTKENRDGRERDGASGSVGSRTRGRRTGEGESPATKLKQDQEPRPNELIRIQCEILAQNKSYKIHCYITVMLMSRASQILGAALRAGRKNKLRKRTNPREVKKLKTRKEKWRTAERSAEKKDRARERADGRSRALYQFDVTFKYVFVKLCWKEI